MPDQSQPTHFLAFERMIKALSEHGIDEETQAIIIGKLSTVVLDTATTGVIETIGAEKFAEIEQLEDLAAQQAAVEAAFQEKKGMSIEAYREHVADEAVKEFEATL